MLHPQTKTTEVGQTDQMHVQPAAQWAMCWAAAIGKCSGYPGCTAECSFYQPAAADATIEVTAAEFRESVQ